VLLVAVPAVPKFIHHALGHRYCAVFKLRQWERRQLLGPCRVLHKSRKCCFCMLNVLSMNRQVWQGADLCISTKPLPGRCAVS
jgi:hypothetical protein